MSMLRVGVTPSLKKDDPSVHEPTKDMLHSMAMAGMEPVVLDYPLDEAAILPVLDTLDGIIFAGGPDMHPRHFGQEVDPHIGFIHEERDELELFLMKWVLEKKLPILGVCRGMQVINIAMGGTIHQDLVHNQGLIHRQTNDMVYFHDVIFEGKSMLSSMVSSTRYPTNSYHHQAVDRIADGLVITAHAPDGVVEAFEGTGSQFILGTQWHPEDTYDNDVFSRRIFARFAEACRESRQPVYITVNGRGDTVLMGMAEYEQMKAELELLRMLAESEEDVRAGRVAPVEDTFDEIRQALLQRKER